jgi:tRNA threonylcarbamoyladenosine biosynthesis protein TsaE
MIDLHADTVDDTRAIAAAVARCARPGDLIVLAGEMGAGKTAFAQGFARELGIHESVTSPTYTLVHTYQAGSTVLHHADLYRLDTIAEIEDLAFDELLEEGIVLVEWGDVADLGPNLQIALNSSSDNPDARNLTISSSDRRWAARWERLEAVVEPWVAA